jgi:MFS family permease
LLLAGVGVLASTAVGTLNPFLVRAGTEVGFATGSAGVLLSVSALGLIASRVLWGAALDRTGLEPVRIVALLLGVGVIGYGLLATTHRASFAVGAIIAYSFGWAWPGVQFLAGVRLWPDNPGEASGVLQMGAFMGATAGPLSFGLLVERTSFTTGYAAAACVAALGAAMAALLARDLARRAARTDPARAG